MTANHSAVATLELLGGFAVSVKQVRIQLTWSMQRLLAFLALQDRSVGRGYTAGVLWPETTTLRANANLRTSLWRAQRTEGQLIEVGGQQIALAPQVDVDVRYAEHCAHRLLDQASPCGDILTAATCAVLSTDLLPDWYDDDWVEVERERHHHLRLHALEAMCERLAKIGRYGEAVNAGLAAVRAEPLRESAHRVLIEAHLAAGNRWAALQQYEACRHLLRAQLDVEPSSTLRNALPLPLPLAPASRNHSVNAKPTRPDAAPTGPRQPFAKMVRSRK